jgi:hypothetical protein
VGLVLITTGACSLTSLDDLQGGKVKVDAGTDASTDGPLVDAPEDVKSCDANLTSDPSNCGACGTVCDQGDVCKSSICVPCDSTEEDCDGDGWLVADGDCCDKVGQCGDAPELINPGALELTGNAIDDNCNQDVDLFDVPDTLPCDTGLYSDSSDAQNHARALGICRTTEADPAALEDKTWGLVEASITRADGSPLADLTARSIRTGFGGVTPSTLEGDSIVVLSTGIAADATQTTPGPNQGAPAGFNVSNIHTPASLALIDDTCTSELCIVDWFHSANPPLKAIDELPTPPDCPPQNIDTPSEAHDSVMLTLTLRAPTNVKAFTFNTYFLSAEYPEYVCSDFNDQYLALVDTPSGPATPPNPPDKNLLTYSAAGKKWPIGINVAAGTNLFAVCDSETANPTCWDTDLDPTSCSLGSAQLLGTGFEATTSAPCLIGGGTHWLTVSGNVVPGELMRLRLVIWDVGDYGFDSVALIDGFKWLTTSTQPGTTGGA